MTGDVQKGKVACSDVGTFNVSCRNKRKSVNTQRVKLWSKRNLVSFTFLQQPSLQYSLKKKHFSPHCFETGWVVLSSWTSGGGRGRQNFFPYAPLSLSLSLRVLSHRDALPVDTSRTVSCARLFYHSSEENGNKRPVSIIHFNQVSSQSGSVLTQLISVFSHVLLLVFFMR